MTHRKKARVRNPGWGQDEGTQPLRTQRERELRLSREEERQYKRLSGSIRTWEALGYRYHRTRHTARLAKLPDRAHSHGCLQACEENKMVQGWYLKSGHQAPTRLCIPQTHPSAATDPRYWHNTLTPDITPPTCSLPFPEGCGKQDRTHTHITGHTAITSTSLAAHSPCLSGFRASQLLKGYRHTAVASP